MHGLGQRPKVLDLLGSGGMPEQEAREPALSAPQACPQGALRARARGRSSDAGGGGAGKDEVDLVAADCERVKRVG